MHLKGNSRPPKEAQRARWRRQLDSRQSPTHLEKTFVVFDRTDSGPNIVPLMDPLSITSAVVGLLTVTGKVYALLEGLSAIRNAPATIKDAQKEVRHAAIALRSMQRLLQRLSVANGRRCLIQVDELRVTLSDAMQAFSALETMLKHLTGLTRFRVTISWVKFSKQLDEHMARIGRYQRSITLMMSILQCYSDVEAYQSQEKLQTLIERVLAENTELKQKLIESEDSFDARSLATRRLEVENATIWESETGNDNASTIRGIRRTHSTRSAISNFGTRTIRFAFENILEQSWVYRKNANQVECDRSCTSTVQRSHAWSVFSGYSLADISVLSVIAMPLTRLDIENGEHYVVHPGDGSLMESQDGMDLAINNLGIDFWPNPPDSKHLQGNSPRTDAQAAQSVLPENWPPDSPASGAIEAEATPATSTLENGELRQDAVEGPNTLLMDQESSHTTVSVPPVSPLPQAPDTVSVIADTDSVQHHGHDAPYLSDDELLVCNGCGEILEEGEAFELAGNLWHLDCFRCATCEKLLDITSTNLCLENGSLMCNNCISCVTCGNIAVFGCTLSVGQAVCATCFRCWKCKRDIMGRGYIRLNHAFFCMKCHRLSTGRRRRKMRINEEIFPIALLEEEEESDSEPEGVSEAEESSQAVPSWATDTSWAAPPSPPPRPPAPVRRLLELEQWRCFLDEPVLSTTGSATTAATTTAAEMKTGNRT